MRDQRRVMDQVGVVEHHALGRARRAGSVLQEGERLAVDVRMLPLSVEPFGQLAGVQPSELLEVRRGVDQAARRAPAPSVVVRATLASASSAIA